MQLKKKKSEWTFFLGILSLYMYLHLFFVSVERSYAPVCFGEGKQKRLIRQQMLNLVTNCCILLKVILSKSVAWLGNFFYWLTANKDIFKVGLTYWRKLLKVFFELAGLPKIDTDKINSQKCVFMILASIMILNFRMDRSGQTV